MRQDRPAGRRVRPGQGQAGGQLAPGTVQLPGRQPAGVAPPRGISGAAADTYVLLGAYRGQLVLDLGADRRAGVQGLEAARQLAGIPVQLRGGELADRVAGGYATR